MVEPVSLLGGGVAALALVWGGLRWRTGAWGLPHLLPLSEAGKERVRRGAFPPWSWRLRGAGIMLLGLHLAASPSSSYPGAALAEDGPVVVLALDVSASMAIRDMGQSSRLETARREALRLVRRTGEGCRVGLVVFGREARTLVPPTSSRSHVVRVLEQVEASPVEDATALGEGVGLAAHRAVAGFGDRRVVVVFTDGRSNAGAVEPFTAASWARRLGVRVYAVGVGGAGGVEPLAEEALAGLAREGGGRYFRASDAKGLAESLRQVEEEVGAGRLSRAGGVGWFQGLFLWTGVGCLLLEGALRSRKRERVP